MCTVLLPPGDNPFAVNKYIYIYLSNYTLLSEVLKPRQSFWTTLYSWDIIVDRLSGSKAKTWLYTGRDKFLSTNPKFLNLNLKKLHVNLH